MPDKVQTDTEYNCLISLRKKITLKRKWKENIISRNRKLVAPDCIFIKFLFKINFMLFSDA